MKKKIAMVLIIVITITCILLGIHARHHAKMVITQLAGEGNGYVLETSDNHLVIIDGGSKADVENLKKVIREKGDNQVLAWFLTSPVSSNTGAFLEILENAPEISITHIYGSLNSGEWYEQTGIEETEVRHIKALLETISSEENLPKYIDLQRRVRYKLDNYFVIPLELRKSESNKVADHTVILKVDNSFKSAIFYGNIGSEESHLFYENDKDQFDADLIQISTNGEEMMSQELFEKMKAKQMLISGKNFFNTEMTTYTKENGEVTIEIW